MKRLSRATTAVDFISQATSGEMKKEKKTNTNLSNVRFTNTQWKLIDQVLEISNIRTKTALFSTVAEFMRSDFNCLDYVDYLDFITGIGVKGSGKAYPIQKNRAYEFFYRLYEDYRSKLGKYPCAWSDYSCFYITLCQKIAQFRFKRAFKRG